MQENGFAADYYAMIVRGGLGVTTSYADGVLTVTIRKAHIAAGNPLNYAKLPVGSAAWVAATAERGGTVLSETKYSPHPSAGHHGLPWRQQWLLEGITRMVISMWRDLNALPLRCVAALPESGERESAAG